MARRTTRSTEPLPQFPKPKPPEPETIRRTVTMAGQANPAPAVTLPTAQTGVPVPYVAGTYRIFQTNILWYGNLRPIKETIVTDGGEEETIDENGNTIITKTKIITEQIVGWKVDMQMQLCLGPGVRLRAIRENSEVIWEGDLESNGPQTISRYDFPVTSVDPTKHSSATILGDIVFYGGNFDQPVDAHLSTHTDEDVPGYVGIAYVILKDLTITNGMATYHFDVERFPNPVEVSPSILKIGSPGVDINPACLIADIISNEWGGAGVNKSALDMDSFLTAAQLYFDEGNGASMYAQQDSSANDRIGPLLDQTGSVLYHHPGTGKLVLKPIRPEDSEDVIEPVFDRSNVKEVSNWDKPSWAGSVSHVRGRFTDREGEYGEGIVAAQAMPVDLIAGKKRSTLTIDYPCVMTKELCEALIRLDLNDISIPKARAKRILTNRKAASLLPGDFFVLNWPEYGYSEEKFLVRKRRDLYGSTSVSLDCEHVYLTDVGAIFEDNDPRHRSGFPTLVAPVQVKLVQSLKNGGSVPANADIKSPVSSPRGGSNPRDGSPDIPWFLVRAANSDQYNYSVEVMNTPGGVAGHRLAVDGKYATYGTLVSAIGKYDDWEDGLISDIALENVERVDDLVDALAAFDNSPADDIAGNETRPFVFINDEIFVPGAVTKTGATTCTLHNVYRAAFDTVAESHDAGDEVWAGRPRSAIEAPFIAYFSPSWGPPQFRLRSWRAKLNGSILRSIDFTDVYGYDLDDNRFIREYKPHDTRINGNRHAIASNIGFYSAGESVLVSWANRTREQGVPGYTNGRNAILPQYAESAADTVHRIGYSLAAEFNTHTVWFEDAEGTVTSLGTTDGTTEELDTLNVVFPADAASGQGWLWVDTKSPTGALGHDKHTSLYQDRMPILIDAEIEGTSDGDFIVTTDGETILIKE